MATCGAASRQTPLPGEAGMDIFSTLGKVSIRRVARISDMPIGQKCKVYEARSTVMSCSK